MIQTKDDSQPEALFSRVLVDVGLIKDRVGAQDYDQLTSWLLETCDDLMLSRTAKFNARHILDLALLGLDHLLANEHHLIAMACIIVAVQDTQDKPVELLPQSLSFEDWIQEQSLNPFLKQVKGIIHSVSQVQSASPVSIDPVATSPYDLVSQALSDCGLESKHIEAVRQGIESVIDLAITNSELGEYSVQEIFEGSWLAFLSAKMESWRAGGKLLSGKKPNARRLLMKSYILAQLQA